MPTIVDSYSEANRDAGARIKAVWSGDGSALGNSFVGDGQRLYSCKFFLGDKTGSPGNMIARLYAHTGTFGSSSVPTGGVLDSSDLIAASGVGAGYVLFEFTGFSGYILVNGTHYCIVLEGYDGTWSINDFVRAGVDNSSPTHSGNYFYYNGSGWVDVAASDLCFYVYGTDILGSILRIRLNGTTYGIQLVEL